jgi:Fe-S-cluster containining protein
VQKRVSLPLLDQAIEAHAAATRAAHPSWPCAAGCDLCCRSLPFLPTISEPEWQRLAEALSQLPLEQQAEIRERTAAAPERGPLTCPMLALESGQCRVYEARPIACRSYGFYTERDAGLHCERVTEAIAPFADQVVWGNGEAIARTLREAGEPVSLRVWIR